MGDGCIEKGKLMEEQEYLYLDKKGWIGIHYFSMMNHFMDCIVWVMPEHEEKAKECIREGIRNFYDETTDSYIDEIEYQLQNCDFKYEIESDKFVGEDETSDEWDEYAKKYKGFVCY